MTHKRYDITPVPKPRQTRADKWKQRPPVMRYRAFADEVRLKLPTDIDFSNVAILFILPMPKSWSKKKKGKMGLTVHRQTPDIDNLCKALLDAYHKDDSGIYCLRAAKIWGYDGSIHITDVGPFNWTELLYGV